VRRGRGQWRGTLRRDRGQGRGAVRRGRGQGRGFLVAWRGSRCSGLGRLGTGRGAVRGTGRASGAAVTVLGRGRQ